MDAMTHIIVRQETDIWVDRSERRTPHHMKPGHVYRLTDGYRNEMILSALMAGCSVTFRGRWEGFNDVIELAKGGADGEL